MKLKAFKLTISSEVEVKVLYLGIYYFCSSFDSLRKAFHSFNDLIIIIIIIKKKQPKNNNNKKNQNQLKLMNCLHDIAHN